ncbi:hypothetical protein, partial [Listeria monocytogenes]|uniref:hypothetical protein n=1 Tax=Listeria monocytogenes TaxID=1639 RepID=UPI003FA47A8C
VFASAALIGREAVVHLIWPQKVAAEGWAIAIMGLSLALTAVLVILQTRVLKQTASVAVSGDRAHYVADFAS